MRTVIFDLDGVLIDSEHLWRKAYPIAYKRYFDDEAPDLDLSKFQGWRFIEVAARFVDLTTSGDRMVDRSVYLEFEQAVLDVMLDLVEREAKPIEGSLKRLHDFRSQGAPLALASSSPRSLVENELALLGLGDVFDAVITGDDVKSSKPDPMIYLTAAHELNVAPSDCLVIEDSPVGVTAALRAGMACIMLMNSSTPPLPWVQISRCSALVCDLRFLETAVLVGLESGVNL